MAIIRTTAELMQEQKRTVAEYEEAKQILAEAERTSNLIEELLTLARADSQATEMSFSEVNPCEVASEVMFSTAALAESKNISLEASIPDLSVIVSGDYDAIRRLMLIFVDNAIKYSAPGTEVLTSVSIQESSAVIEVRDEGIGIAKDDLPHIFERFYRADKARSREMGGAGLGLSIAKWIADSHRAQIEVESVLGKGSTFRVVFASGSTK